MKLVVCGYGYVGARVLEYAVANLELEDVYLVTHEPASWVEDARATADDLGVKHTTESINKTTLPFQPDVITSVWYRNVVRPHVIDSVKGRIFNLHPSLLPRHRGCSSVPWAIIEGDSETGVTAHYIDHGVDTGRILCQRRTPIRPDDTQLSLYERCSRLAVDLWPEALRKVVEGEPGVEQPVGGSYHPRGAPYAGEIDDRWSDLQVESFIRAMTFPPLPYARYRGTEISTIEGYYRIRQKTPPVDRDERANP